MIESMTGYGTASQRFDLGGGLFASISAECRSVNSRFLDLNLRLPDECRPAELAIRDLVHQHIQRGKLDIRLQYQLEEASNPSSAELIDPDVLQKLLLAQEQIRHSVPDAGQLRMADILRWPGLIREAKGSEQAWREASLSVVRQAITTMKEARRSEGQALALIMKQKTQAIREIVKQLEPLMPQIVAAHQNKLQQKLTEMLAGQDAQGQAIQRQDIAERVRQELILYGVKIDVAEELGRLCTHLDAIDQALNKGGAVGKRLDFIMQELNREANTLGSKSVSQESSQASIEIKILIEQMREQVQNLE